ncbi:MAG: hypothetical protein A2Y62_21475 [Candidatus Fischerbacteria bacterium RBG_13_37_8]|uniref:Uncharacterized protein n=1 Tax=Candidatus Fischerbacteria bacterium RBG_13_37_8 TaxID=1817863 RepID=A0A1F5VSD7_9BACT|nr:MAG: hypothetical protein A2Y62_21475 [Candidatus Fischerbacteria bacterium RBG_13_37_8]
MIISVPVQTAVSPYRAEGTFVKEVAIQMSVAGLYLPPLLNIASQGDAIGLMEWWNGGIMGSEVDVG